MTNPNPFVLFTGSAATWVDTVAPSAFEALANTETGVSFGASISSTRLLPMYSGCFGPMAKVRNEMRRIKCDSNAIQIHVVKLTFICLFLLHFLRMTARTTPTQRI